MVNKPYVILERGDIKAVIANNEAIDDEILPGHMEHYSGLASLTHTANSKNIFVHKYAGLNFEHIHDGTTQVKEVQYEPRYVPMEIREVDKYIVELYQPPTPHWKVESWLRYELLDDGCIEMTLECVPHARIFKHNYIGIFFASYIDKPESKDIHFLGCPAEEPKCVPRWIRGETAKHGLLATHRAIDDNRQFAYDEDFFITLAFNFSNYRYSEPWYYGVSNGMALVFMFRRQDNVMLTQSPSGGGGGNPAWDFQWFIPDYEISKRYKFVMRMMYLPYESPEQIRKETARHRADLN